LGPGFAFQLPLVLMGFPLGMLALVSGLNLVYQFWIHTEVIRKMPAWFEALFNTPSHHRVHHATNARYLDSNYAGVFIVWDRMFGTFVAENSSDAPRYGIIKNLGTFNPLKVALHEWVGILTDLVRSRSPREAALYLLAPPGWSSDGSRDTSDSIKARWAGLKGLAAE
jgi:sterol desaturase/sphingolipid hydroxylase (fatty acid hydroxylase superfamily)